MLHDVSEMDHGYGALVLGEGPWGGGGREGQKFRFGNFGDEDKFSKFQNNFIAKNRRIWNWYRICTVPEGANPSPEVIANFEVTPGILTILKCPKIRIISQGERPGSDARAIICGKKLMTYVDFVIKYLMDPQSFGENSLLVKKDGFYSPSL